MVTGAVGFAGVAGSCWVRSATSRARAPCVSGSSALKAAGSPPPISPCDVTIRIWGSAHDFFADGEDAKAGGTSARQSIGRRTRRRISCFQSTGLS